MQGTRKLEASTPEAQPPIPSDAEDDVLRTVLDRCQRRRVRPWAGSVVYDRRGQVDGLAQAFATIGGASSIQRMLDRVARGEVAPDQDLDLEHAVEVLVPVAGLRMGETTVAQAYTEAGESDVQARELP